MKMNNIKLSKRNTFFIRPPFILLILLTLLTTCKKNPTGPIIPEVEVQVFSINTLVNKGKEAAEPGSNIIVEADTITAFVSLNFLPAEEKYISFDLINTPGELIPKEGITDTFGIATSIYKFVYVDELLSDSGFVVSIDIGVGNDSSSIAFHDTLVYSLVLEGMNPISGIATFNYSPNWSYIYVPPSEILKLSVIVKNDAGAGVCNIPVQFQIISDSSSTPNGVINSGIVHTCESSNSEGESGGSSNIFGKASVDYINDVGGIEYLIAKIIDPSNELLYLFADTIKIETGSSELVSNVVDIALNVSQSNIVISDVDSMKTDTIWARALNADGAVMSNIPFQFSLNNNYNGSAYLSEGNAMSNFEGIASSILNVNPSIFSSDNNTSDLLNLELQVNVSIPSADLSNNVIINIFNNLPHNP